MISKDFAKKQIGRLMGLDHFPQASPAINELVVALEGANNERTAQVIVDAVCASWTVCPKPSEIREQVYSLNSQERSVRQGCVDCGGTGWLVKTIQKFGRKYDVAEHCKCHAGHEAA